MKVKIFNGFGEYSRDMEFEEFAKTGFEFSCREEFNICNTMKSIIRISKNKKIGNEKIKENLMSIYKNTAWNTYMYEDRFEYFMNKFFNK